MYRLPFLAAAAYSADQVRNIHGVWAVPYQLSGSFLWMLMLRW